MKIALNKRGTILKYSIYRNINLKVMQRSVYFIGELLAYLKIHVKLLKILNE